MKLNVHNKNEKGKKREQNKKNDFPSESIRHLLYMYIWKFVHFPKISSVWKGKIWWGSTFYEMEIFHFMFMLYCVIFPYQNSENSLSNNLYEIWWFCTWALNGNVLQFFYLIHCFAPNSTWQHWGKYIWRNCWKFINVNFSFFGFFILIKGRTNLFGVKVFIIKKFILNIIYYNVWKFG